MIRNFFYSEDAVTAVEYAVMVALLILAILASVISLSQSLTDHFNSVETTVDGL
jgi:Flp pilus assembly pilin Flp